METTDDPKANWSWLLNVLTDVQFWVPVVVLLVGLLLLRAMH